MFTSQDMARRSEAGALFMWGQMRPPPRLRRAPASLPDTSCHPRRCRRPESTAGRQTVTVSGKRHTNFLGHYPFNLKDSGGFLTTGASSSPLPQRSRLGGEKASTSGRGPS
ncbi:hypothetical protein GCM10010176_103940 [Nonomuraea spiralis]|nr:hypothetical protein GCM10010176_103940 [Nonomuraea spiralis]